MPNNVTRLIPKGCIGIESKCRFDVTTMTPEQKDRIILAAIRVALCIENCEVVAISDDWNTNELIDALSKAVRETAIEVPMAPGEYFKRLEP